MEHDDFIAGHGISSVETPQPSRTVTYDDGRFLCGICRVNTLEINEYYMVQFDLWQRVVPKELQGGLLCVGCLEGFLGRQLVSEDFTEAHVNYTPDKSERLLNRLGDWFRAFDGPLETLEELHAASVELGRRIDGLVPRKRL